MVKTIRNLLIYVSLGLFFAFPLCASENGIRVSGSSKVSIAPDIARFTFAVNERGMDLVDVKSSVDEKTSNLVNICKNLGVDIKDISSSEISIYPQYDYKTREFTGYDVSRYIKVTLNDLNKYADQYTKLINGSIKSGITNIRSIILDTTKRDELKLQALKAALKSAKNKALGLAESAGVSLGDVLNIEESGIPTQERMYSLESKRVMVSQEEGAFQPGEISVSATVVVKYSIERVKKE